jgi:hypothetical protein
VSEKDLDDLAHMAAVLTGRGDLPQNLGTLPVIFNSLFFSPRYIASRLQMLNPMTYARLTPLVRKEAMRDVASYFGTGLMGMTMVGYAAKAGILPDAHVELDPRSSDFGKLRIGKARLDPWAGFQPLARYMAQFLMGESKNSLGEIDERGRATTLGNFARGKMGPVPSFLVDAITGTSFIGAEVDVNTGAGVDRALAERMIPLFLQDMAEAFSAEGYAGMAKTAPGFLGVGTQTYNSNAAIQQAGAQEMFGKPWTALTGQEMSQVKEAYATEFAKVAPPADGSVKALIDAEDMKLRSLEQQLNAGVQSGRVQNKNLTQAIGEAQAARYNNIQGIRAGAGIIDPNEPETVLDIFYGLRQDAIGPDGLVDYALLDQLQENFMAGLSPEDRRVVEERSTFAHDTSIQWWVDGKKTIQESGYYKVQSDTIESLQPMLTQVGLQGLTYNQILARMGSSDNPAEARLIDRLLKRVDRVAEKRQERMRRGNPELDQALALVYGSTPIRQRRR